MCMCVCVCVCVCVCSFVCVYAGMHKLCACGVLPLRTLVYACIIKACMINLATKEAKETYYRGKRDLL